MIKFGICFSKKFEGNEPLSHIIDIKYPVYIRLLELIQKEGWEVYVLTRRTYQGHGVFNGAWLFEKDKFIKKDEPFKIDVVFDRTGGVEFPPDEESGLRVVNSRDFKVLCWNKWLAYKELGKYMPETRWEGDISKKGKARQSLKKALSGVKGEWVVLKPYDGQQGIGVFVGTKDKAYQFKVPRKYPKYVVQEFVDTSFGIDGIASGLHDLRVAIVNGKPVWCHVRTPAAGSFKANVAEGGTLTEVDYQRVPGSIKEIIDEITPKFSKKYDNPTYSLDFGIGKDGKPKIFEINDQIGFPRWEMKNREVFLAELVENFKQKLD